MFNYITGVSMKHSMDVKINVLGHVSLMNHHFSLHHQTIPLSIFSVLQRAQHRQSGAGKIQEKSFALR